MEVDNSHSIKSRSVRARHLDDCQKSWLVAVINNRIDKKFKVIYIALSSSVTRRHCVYVHIGLAADDVL